MAKKDEKRPTSRPCDNDGGLGIPPCESDWPATETLLVDPAFTCMDTETLHLCGECADLFVEHAGTFDVDVTVVGDS